MNNVQMLVPMEPNAFWQQLRTIVSGSGGGREDSIRR